MTDEERKARKKEYGKRWREKHPEKVREYSRVHYETRKAAGLCVRCGKKANPDYSLCDECLEKQRVYVYGVRLKRLREHICVTCGKELGDDEHQECFECLVYRSKLRKLRKREKDAK